MTGSLQDAQIHHIAGEEGDAAVLHGKDLLEQVLEREEAGLSEQQDCEWLAGGETGRSPHELILDHDEHLPLQLTCHWVLSLEVGDAVNHLGLLLVALALAHRCSMAASSYVDTYFLLCQRMTGLED